ncbi:hypothetical protein NW754_013610, partial [Fusarium falciforme]
NGGVTGQQDDVSIVFVTPESTSDEAVLGLSRVAAAKAILTKSSLTSATRSWKGPLLPALAFTRTRRPRTGRVADGLPQRGATLPPTLEYDFFSIVNARAEDVVMIRARTTRGNVVYSVISVPATTAREATAAIVNQAKEVIDRKLEEHLWPAKVIVYCQRVDATEDLAKELGCDAYHREVDTRDGKAERLRLWMSGSRRGQYGEGG